MPTIRATGNRDPPNRCVREFMTRHNRGVGIIPVRMRFDRSAWGVADGCSRTLSKARTRAPISIRSSRPAKQTASIPTGTSPGCSSACLWRRPSTTTTRCFPGKCRPTSADPHHYHTSRAPPPYSEGRRSWIAYNHSTSRPSESATVCVRQTALVRSSCCAECRLIEGKDRGPMRLNVPNQAT